MSGNGPKENYPSPYKNIYQIVPVHDDIVSDKSNKRWKKEGSGSAMKRKIKGRRRKRLFLCALEAFGYIEL